MRPKTYYAQVRLVCPYCRKPFIGEGRSDRSQIEANGIAEQGAYGKLNSHIRKIHGGKQDVQ